MTTKAAKEKKAARKKIKIRSCMGEDGAIQLGDS